MYCSITCYLEQIPHVYFVISATGPNWSDSTYLVHVVHSNACMSYWHCIIIIYDYYNNTSDIPIYYVW